MAQHASAAKAAKQAIKRKMRNKSMLSKMKTAIKKVMQSKDKEKAFAELKKTCKLLDQIAAKGIIHKNKSANHKSALMKYVNKLQ